MGVTAMKPKIQVTEKGLFEYNMLPTALQKYMVEILSNEPLTITQLIRQIQLRHHEYRYVELKVYMTALAPLIKDEMVLYNV